MFLMILFPEHNQPVAKWLKSPMEKGLYVAKDYVVIYTQKENLIWAVDLILFFYLLSAWPCNLSNIF